MSVQVSTGTYAVPLDTEHLSMGDITKSGHNKICEAPHLGRLESLRVSVTEVQRKFAVETMPGHNR